MDWTRLLIYGIIGAIVVFVFFFSIIPWLAGGKDDDE